MKIRSLLSMTRPGNSVMAAVGISIGVLFSSEPNVFYLICLIIAGMAALSFGNVINDIFDIETDKIAHPERALVTGAVSISEARWFALVLVVISILAGFLVSVVHGFATLIPVVLLSLYAWKLKGTPLVGNILVSLLVAYTLIFGALSGKPSLVILPAFLAFLINLIREIIKDLQDEVGDRSAGIVTTASLDKKLVDRILVFLVAGSMLSASALLLFQEFQMIYPFVFAIVIVPLQIHGCVLHRQANRAAHSSNLKLQLLAGLLGIAAEGIRYAMN